MRIRVLTCDERGRVLGVGERGPSNGEVVGIGGAGAVLRVVTEIQTLGTA